MDWMKASTGLASDERAMIAGDVATIVYLHLLGINTAKGRNGRLKAKDSNPNLIAARMAARGWTSDQVEQAIEALVEVELLARDGDTIVIADWDERWAPQCSSCRKRAAEPGKRTCHVCLEARGKADPKPAAKPTPRSSAEFRGTDRNSAEIRAGGEERRGEESTPHPHTSAVPVGGCVGDLPDEEERAPPEQVAHLLTAIDRTANKRRTG